MFCIIFLSANIFSYVPNSGRSLRTIFCEAEIAVDCEILCFGKSDVGLLKAFL